MNLAIILTSSALMSSCCVSGNIPRSLGDALRNWSTSSKIWEISIFLRDKMFILARWTYPLFPLHQSLWAHAAFRATLPTSKALSDAARNWSVSSMIWEVSSFLHDEIIILAKWTCPLFSLNGIAEEIGITHRYHKWYRYRGITEKGITKEIGITHRYHKCVAKRPGNIAWTQYELIDADEVKIMGKFIMPK